MTNQISATAHTASNLATAQPVQDMVPLRQLKFNQPIGFELGGYTVGHAATMSRCNAVGTIVGVEESDGRRTVTLEFSEPQPTDVDGVSSGVVAQMPVAAEVGSGDERDELGSG